MSILTNVDIMNILATEKSKQIDNKMLIIDYDENHLTPIGYDLRVGGRVALSSIDGGAFNISNDDELSIPPNEFAYLATLEEIRMPLNGGLSGLLISKGSIAAKGLVHDTTSIDPDWSGNLLIIFYNASTKQVKLKYGQPICTAIFFSNNTATTHEYHKKSMRPDLFPDNNNYFDKKIKIKRNRRIKDGAISIFSTAIFASLGYLFFKDSTGATASAALGLALSQQVINRVNS